MEDYLRILHLIETDPEQALLESGRAGYIPIVNFLLDQGAQIKSKFLNVISSTGQTEVLQSLLDRGFVQLENSFCSKIAYAARAGHTETVRFFLQSGCQNVDLALVAASRHGHLNVVKLILRQGTYTRRSLFDSLVQAAENGHVDIVRILPNLAEDAIQVYEGYLGEVFLKDTHQVAKLFLEHGANPLGRNGEILRIIIRGGPHANRSLESVNTYKLFLDFGANIPGFLERALIESTNYGNPEFVRLALTKGANPSANSEEALQAAARNNYLDIARLLLDAGANPSANISGPLRSAATFFSADMVQLLLERGAVVNDEVLQWARESGVNVEEFIIDWVQRLRPQQSRRSFLTRIRRLFRH
jgi:ankyrin repeat protein